MLTRPLRRFTAALNAAYANLAGLVRHMLTPINPGQCSGLFIEGEMILRSAVPEKPTRRRCYLLVFLWICLVPSCIESAWGATHSQAIHGRWAIDLEVTKKESLLVYFTETEEHDLLTKASSTIFTFDTQKMVFIRSVLGKETRFRIQSIEQSQNHAAATPSETLTVWLRHVKFPDYIIPLPEERIRYGSRWGRPWEFILKKRK